MSRPVLELDGVQTHFPVTKGLFFERQVATVRAVDGVSLALAPGEILGLVGESGCGKSTLARTILQLVPHTAGRIVVNGQALEGLSRAALRAVRRHLQIVFQDPYASLNPRMTVFDAIAEPLLTHRIVPRSAVRQRVAELMERVGMAPRYIRKYPHEFSGGQRQRIAIARALALEPTVLIADEPVSALDVSVQAQILNLLAQLRADTGLSMVFISHDLSVVKHIADRIAVMYLGVIVEEGPADAVFYRPQHPYTRALISAIPLPDPALERRRTRIVLPGEPPSPLDIPAGCRFAPRCPYAAPECRAAEPALALTHHANHRAACIRLDAIPPYEGFGVSA